MTSDDIDPSKGDTEGPACRVGLLLVQDFALMAYASAVEPLRAANRLSGRQLYSWRHASVDGLPVSSSSGLSITPDLAPGAAAGLDYLFVCAGGNPAAFRHKPTFAWLRALARAGTRLGGISGGPYLLAHAGLLGGYRFTIHWEHAEAFREEFPDHDLRRSLFEIDRDRLTSSGGTAALDMMHAVIAREHGSDLALRVSDWFLQTEIRAEAGPQRLSLRERLGVAHGPLLAVVAAMEERIEEPVSRSELARTAGLSVRQLERLFQTRFGQTPGAYYLGLRLDRARHLMRQTSLSVTEAALACGFASPSHFSRVYRARHGHPPRRERQS